LIGLANFRGTPIAPRCASPTCASAIGLETKNIMRQAPKTLWYTRYPHPSPLGLAAQLGWFLDEFAEDGISVFTLQETSDPHLIKSHLDHHLTSAFRQGGSVPAIWARSLGADTRIIGFNWVDEFQAILCLPGSGIVTPADLRGRRAALPRSAGPIDWRRAETLRGFAVALGSVGLDIEAPCFVDVFVPGTAPSGAAGPARHVGYDRVVEALAGGEVDAIYVKGSRGFESMHLAGAQVVFDARTQADPQARVNHGTPRPITVDASFLREHPDVVARFLTRVVAVGDWASQHPDETILYVSRETRSAERWVRGAYGPDLHHQQRTVINTACTDALRTFKSFLLAQGFIREDFPIEEWIDPAPLAAATEQARARPVKRYLRAL